MSDPAKDHRYLLALGGNVRHRDHGAPRAVLAAALAALAEPPLCLVAASPVLPSAPLGPSRREFANAAAVIATRLEPAALLAALKRLEREFGRRAGGPRWGARVLDIDIILWSGGAWWSPLLTIPHPEFRRRRFVLAGADRVARRWRDPITALTVGQLAFRLMKPHPA